MSTYDDLLQQYITAQQELDEAEKNRRFVEERHGGGSGNVHVGQPIQYLDIGHPEVQEAWDRVEKANESVAELRRQLRDSKTTPGA